MGEKRNAYRIFVGKPEGRRPLGRQRRRWADNIKMDLVCMYKGRAIHGPCTATHSGLLCFPFNLSLQQSRTSDELQDLVRGGVEIVTWFHKKMDLREMEWDGVDWIDVAQNRDQWRALVNTVLNIRVP
jgi:hypothetical protein